MRASCESFAYRLYVAHRRGRRSEKGLGRKPNGAWCSAVGSWIRETINEVGATGKGDSQAVRNVVRWEGKLFWLP